MKGFWPYGVVALLGVALWISVQRAERSRRECARLEANQAALLDQAQEYRVRDSLNAATVRVLTVRASEMREHFASMEALVRDMGIRMRRLEAVSQAAVESRYEVAAPLRDTVVAASAAQALRYDNGHLSLEGIIAAGEFRGQILSRDTLTQVLHRVPKRFLFLRWGTREVRQEIVSSNPYSRIVYSRYIKVQK